MASSLPRGAPEDQQVDPAAILRFLDAVEDHPGVEMHSLMVLRHGHVVAEGWWAPYSAERPQLLYSLSKSFTSTAVAFAQAEGLLDLDDTVISHFAEFAADITDPRSRSVKVRHVEADQQPGRAQPRLAAGLRPHRPGRVAPPTARPQRAPAPALPRLRHATCNRRAAPGYRTRGRDTATFQIVLSGIRTTPQRPPHSAVAAGFTGLALARLGRGRGW